MTENIFTARIIKKCVVKVIGMQKKFNVNGVCYPDRHYMVDLNGRLKKIRRLVDNGDYFVINQTVWENDNTAGIKRFSSAGLYRHFHEFSKNEFCQIQR